MLFKNYYLSIYRKNLVYNLYMSLKGMGGVQDGSAGKDTPYYSRWPVFDSCIEEKWVTQVVFQSSWMCLEARHRQVNK